MEVPVDPRLRSRPGQPPKTGLPPPTLQPRPQPRPHPQQLQQQQQQPPVPTSLPRGTFMAPPPPGPAFFPPPLPVPPNMFTTPTSMTTPTSPFQARDPRRAANLPAAPFAYPPVALPTTPWMPYPLPVPISPVGRPHLTHSPMVQSPPPPPSMPSPNQMSRFAPAPGPILSPFVLQGGVVAPGGFPGGPGGVVSQGQSTQMEDPFVAEWLKKVSKHRPGNSAGQHMKIPEMRSLLAKGAELLSRLRSTYQTLTLEDTASRWAELRNKMEEDKRSFLRVRCVLDSSPDLKEHLTRKMAVLHSRRERQRRSWRGRRERRRERMVRAERVSDQWVKRKEEEELKARTEKSVQASASGVLEEVKRKKTELQSLLQLADTLGELRSLRREASRKKGDAPPIEADERFQQNHESLVDLLTQQLGVYEREEHALRVLMEEEVKEKMHSHKSKATASATPHHYAPHPTLPPMDTMEACRQFYLQAEKSQEAKRAIRSEWNVFISPEGSSLLYPLSAPPPGNTPWEQYCSAAP